MTDDERPQLARRRLLAGVAAFPLLATLSACASGTSSRGASSSPSASPDVTSSGVAPTILTLAYGTHPSQSGDLYLPAVASRTSRKKLPVVVVIHGGYWHTPYARDLGAPLAADLATAGIAAWNIDYRRIEEADYPATMLDVAAAVDRLSTLASEHDLDLTKVVGLGHSAGGQLAVWTASRHLLKPGSPGAEPRVRLIGAVSQAGVLDLVQAAEQNLGSGAAVAFLGGTPTSVPARYAGASPYALLPTGRRIVAVHGDADDIVPIEQSKRYVAKATSVGDPAQLFTVAGADHFAMIDVTTEAWATCRRETLSLLGR